MTTTFDGSTPSTDTPAAQNGATVEPEPEYTPVSALDALRDRVSAAESEARDETWTHEFKRTGVRVTCSLDIEAEDFQSWQSAALPQRKRGRGGMPDPTKLRREMLSARALINTCVRLDMRSGTGELIEMRDPQTTEALTLKSPAMLRTFGVPDPIELVRKLAVRDSELISAGENLLTEAGFLGDDDDESDPT